MGRWWWLTQLALYCHYAHSLLQAGDEGRKKHARIDYACLWTLKRLLMPDHSWKRNLLLSQQCIFLVMRWKISADSRKYGRTSWKIKRARQKWQENSLMKAPGEEGRARSQPGGMVASLPTYLLAAWSDHISLVKWTSSEKQSHITRTRQAWP